MENPNTNEKILDNKYILLQDLGSGGSSKVFEVKRINLTSTDKNQELIAKIIKPKFKAHLYFFNNEIKILTDLNKFEESSNYISKLVDFGKGAIMKNGEIIESDNSYLILEYIKNFPVIDYTFEYEKGLPEIIIKIIFEKIIKCVKFLHSKGICHRDLKGDNIILDDNFNPKLIDFGCADYYSKENLQEKKFYGGTISYNAPETRNIKYKWQNADIFSLGIILSTLIFPSAIFENLNTNDKLFLKIKRKNYKDFWEKVQNKNSDFPKISENLKNLFVNMIAFKPDDRPSLDEILNDVWFEEIKNMNENQKYEIIKEELQKRKNYIKNHYDQYTYNNLNNEKDVWDMGDYRGVGNEFKFFGKDVDAKFLDKEKYMKNFISIKGDLNERDLINKLMNLILNQFGDIIDYDENSKYLKFEIKFEKNEEEEEIEEENEEDQDDEEDVMFFKEKNICKIQVKLFKIDSTRYNLRFIKKSGLLQDFYLNLKKIKSLLKKIIY